jgi:hypothetical protein
VIPLYHIGARALGSLSHWGRHVVFPLSRMQLDGQEDAWGVAGGGVGRSSSRRRHVFQKNKAREGMGRIRCSGMCGRPDAWVRPNVQH